MIVVVLPPSRHAPTASLPAPPTRTVAAQLDLPPVVHVRADARDAAPETPLARASAAEAAPRYVAAAVVASTSAGAPSQTVLAAYQRQLYDSIARNSRYPADARRQHLSGVTQLAFRLDRAGNVVDSWIEESSGSELLDTAAIDALTRAQPLPPIPAALPARMAFVIELDSSIVQQVASGSAR